MRPYTQIISLGRACQPRYQLRRMRGTVDAYPFDWIITPDAGLCTVIADDLKGFLDPQLLQRGADGVMRDVRHDIRFVHEFPADQSIEIGLQQHGPRFIQHIRRWQALMASDQRVLFVRQHAWDSDIAAAAVRLSQTLARAAPALDFDLLYLTNPAHHDPARQAPRTVFRPLAQSPDVRWQGDDATWDALLADALAPDGQSVTAPKC